jgi:hypothetical protein
MNTVYIRALNTSPAKQLSSEEQAAMNENIAGDPKQEY